MIDFKLTTDLDICYDENGDLKSVSDYETAYLTGLFFEKRYNDVGGYFGFDDDGEGSHIWIYYNNRLSTDAINNIRQYVRQAYQFLFSDNVIDDIDIQVSLDVGKIKLEISLIKEDLVLEQKEFIL